MPRLETSSGWSRLREDILSLFNPSTGSLSTRLSILKTILFRSVRLSILPSPTSSSTSHLLPLRIRPAFVLLNILDLTLLGILGFHPNGQTWLRLNDKFLHFICFAFATALFYMIWDVDEPATRSSWLWRNAPLLLSGITCFLVGGIGSEVVQSLLPYKVFQWGDVVANLVGSSLGLWFAWNVEKRFRVRRELERLYAPLDAEDYGDFDGDVEDEDEEGDVESGRLPSRSSLKQQNGNAGGGKNKKKARFGDGDIWDDSVEIQTLPPASSSATGRYSGRSASQPAPSSTATTTTGGGAGSDPLSDPLSASSSSAASTAKPRREDLFSIDDDDDEDDDEAATTEGGANVWKHADP